MKKYIITAMIISAVLSSCSTVTQANVSSSTSSEITSAVTGETAETSEAETDDSVISSPDEKPADAPAVTESAGSIPKPTQANGLNYHEYDSFEIDENGAVIEKKDLTELSEEEQMAAAQALYEAACSTEWSYSVGTPYAIDSSQYITNEFDWRYDMIITDGVNSMADIEADYYKVFSRKYPNALNETFIERDGHVYVLNAARGTNIFYVNSNIKSVDSVSADEIRFTVVSNYDGSPFDDSGHYEDEAVFTIVREDNAWRVGEFRLPY